MLFTLKSDYSQLWFLKKSGLRIFAEKTMEEIVRIKPLMAA